MVLLNFVSSLSDKTSRTVEREPYVVYNLINVNMNVGTRVTELKNGDSIDLAQVGRSVSMQADVYNGRMELPMEIVVKLKVNKKVFQV